MTAAAPTILAWREGWAASHLALFPMPNVDDPRAHLLIQDAATGR